MLLASLKSRLSRKTMNKEDHYFFKVIEFSICSETSNDWKNILTILDQYSPYEIIESTENILRLHILVYGDEDLKKIQTLAKQIYSKIMPFGRERVVIID